MFQSDFLHFKESFLLDGILLGIAERDEFAKVIFLVIDELHSLRHSTCLDLGKFALAHAHEFQKIRRRKAGTLAEFAPRERTETLAFVVIILHKEVIVFVFKYRFHTHKSTLILHACQYRIIQKFNFCTYFNNFKDIKAIIFFYIIHAV